MSRFLVEAALTFATLAVVVFGVLVQGWGKEGHEVVANIAYRRLSSQVQQRVQDILQISNDDDDNDNDDYPQTPLGRVADWADIVRYTHEFHWTAPLHFIDIRDDEIQGGCPVASSSSMTALSQGSKRSRSCVFEYSRDCANDWCVAGAIVNYTERVTDASASNVPCQQNLEASSCNNNETQVSLKFITHFVGDIHQPLHCARTTDRGGNSIAVGFNKKKPKPKASFYALLAQKRGGSHHRHRIYCRHSGWNLHSVWDSGIITKSVEEIYNQSQVQFEQAVEEQTNGAPKEWLACANGASIDCVTQWAQESWEDALAYAYADENSQEIVSGTELSDEYYQTRLPIIHKLLAKAAVRLASTLEIALNDGNPSGNGSERQPYVSSSALEGNWENWAWTN